MWFFTTYAAFFGLGPSALPSVQHSPLVGVNSAVTSYIFYKEIKGWQVLKTSANRFGCNSIASLMTLLGSPSGPGAFPDFIRRAAPRECGSKAWTQDQLSGAVADHHTNSLIAYHVLAMPEQSVRISPRMPAANRQL
ncbi:hypothetical protein ACLKA7_001803 [Drosophila subpalustris]